MENNEKQTPFLKRVADLEKVVNELKFEVGCLSQKNDLKDEVETLSKKIELLEKVLKGRG